MRFRIEKDELGELKIPFEAYYGIHTLRSRNLFIVSKRPICRQMIKALALCKKAAAYSNFKAGLISKEKKDAISLSCDEILNGRLHGQFIVDAVQGGAGTAMNMNVNEVVANRANEMMGGEKGVYNFVHPLDDVNKNQSANDVTITAGKISAVRLTKKLLVEMRKLSGSLKEKAKEMKGVFFNSKTHLKNNIPLKYSDFFTAASLAVDRHIMELERIVEILYELPLGGGAIGTSKEINEKYVKSVCLYLAEFSGVPYRQATNLFDNQTNIDDFLLLSSEVVNFSSVIQKLVRDLLLMSTAYGLLKIPSTFPGSSSIPEKENPVILEMVEQIVMYINGNNLTITEAIQGGEMQMNTNIPIVLVCLFENLNFIRRGIRSLRESVLADLTFDKGAPAIDDLPLIALFQNEIGYEEALKIIREVKDTKSSLFEALKKHPKIKAEKLEKLIKEIK